MSGPEAAEAAAPEGVSVAGEPKNYLTESSGFSSWALTLDHKRIGVMYLVAIIFAFFLGGLAAVAIRTHLWVPEGLLFSADNADLYNKFFTVHGAIMIFLVIIPGIPAALGNFILPIMMGAKDVAFPRLNLMSFYFWSAGALMLLSSLAAGGVDTGWTFYAPYSTEHAAATPTAIVLVLSAVFVLGFSSIFTGMNFIVTVHKLRPPGMTWFRMPLFV